MSQHSSPYPRLSADAAGSGVVSQAGLTLLVRTAEKTGLTAALSTALAPWRHALAVHDPCQAPGLLETDLSGFHQTRGGSVPASPSTTNRAGTANCRKHGPIPDNAPTSPPSGVLRRVLRRNSTSITVPGPPRS